MALPPDFEVELAKVERFGILAEDTDAIQKHLVDALAKVNGNRDLGMLDWAKDLLQELEIALHNELCNADKGALKEEYNNLLKQGLTTDGVAAVAAVVWELLKAINPAYAVSSVVIYLGIWLLKVGLNHWCGQSPP